MRYLVLFARLWWRQVRGSAASFGQHSRLKVLVIATFSLGFWAGMYWCVRRAMAFVDATVTVDLARQVDVAMFPLFFASLLVMLAFSNGIIGYTAMFRNRETAFLLALPLPSGAIYLAKLAESLAFSSWAFLFIGSPILLAYGLAREAHWVYYPASVLLFFPFALVPGVIGNACALALVRYFPRTKRAIAVVLTVATAALVLAADRRVRAIDKTHNLFSEVGITELFDRVSFANHPLLPSAWASRAILAAAEGPRRFEAGAFYALTLVAHGAFGLYLAAWFGERQLRAAYDLAHSQGERAGRKRRGTALRRGIDRALPFVPARTRVFLEKDVKTFLRDPVQWSQFLLLFGLLAFYVLNLRTFDYENRPALYRNLISFLNLAATSLVMTTFASRFVFPLLSLEGRRFWILGVAPIDRAAILWGKFAFSLIGLSAVSLSLTGVSCWMLRVPAGLALVQALAMVSISAGVSGLSVGTGAMFPDFREDNPSKIVAGFGGTLNLVLSLSFILAVIAILAVPTHLHFATDGAALAGGWVAAAVAAALVLGVVVALVPMRLGARAFERLEF